MAETETTPQVVRDYLAQLDAALAGVAEPVARDIRAGVVEELTGLDAAAAAGRIEQLGDPAFIAAEARAEAGPPAAPAVTVAPLPAPNRDSLAYTIVAVLLVAVGGFVVPVLGWLVGIAMVWVSRTWTVAEKWTATLAGPVALAALWVARLVPVPMPLWWAAVLVLLFANIVVGIWLLWRARRRS